MTPIKALRLAMRIGLFALALSAASLMSSSHAYAYKFVYVNNSNVDITVTSFLSGLEANPGTITLKAYGGKYEWDPGGALAGYAMGKVIWHGGGHNDNKICFYGYNAYFLGVVLPQAGPKALRGFNWNVVWEGDNNHPFGSPQGLRVLITSRDFDDANPNAYGPLSSPADGLGASWNSC